MLKFQNGDLVITNEKKFRDYLHNPIKHYNLLPRTQKINEFVKIISYRLNINNLLAYNILRYIFWTSNYNLSTEFEDNLDLSFNINVLDAFVKVS